MRNLDEAEIKILKQLVRNPRVSDSQIARATLIPVNTVNRKRKELEGSGIVRYYTSINSLQTGTGKFNTSQVYLIKFKLGYMKQDAPAEMRRFNFNTKPEYSNYICESYVAEIDGHAALILIIDGKSDEDIDHFFNSIFVPDLQALAGEKEIIDQVTTLRVRHRSRLFHNYLPFVNVENGVLRQDWDDSLISVD
jgi:DNA-binding Lrp family transcriptional regulator